MPLHERSIQNGMSYGIGPAGVDIRTREAILLPPHGFGKVSSIEHFDVPRDLMAFVSDKSTWRRKGISVGNTKAEPGWRGYLTLELSNHSWWWRRVRAGDPIAHVIFVRLDEPTELPYSGKYQDQPPRPVGARFETGEADVMIADDVAALVRELYT
jgi:dCTP deaminase